MAYYLRTKAEGVAQAMTARAISQGLYIRAWKDRAGYWSIAVNRLADAKRLQEATPSEATDPTIEHVSGSTRRMVKA